MWLSYNLYYYNKFRLYHRAHNNKQKINMHIMVIRYLYARDLNILYIYAIYTEDL